MTCNNRSSWTGYERFGKRQKFLFWIVFPIVCLAATAGYIGSDGDRPRFLVAALLSGGAVLSLLADILRTRIRNADVLPGDDT